MPAPRATRSAWRCFNETAPVKARKYGGFTAADSSNSRFNETAPVKARKSDAAKVAPLFSEMLQ